MGPRRLAEIIFKETGNTVTLSVGRYLIEDKSLSIAAMFDRAFIAKDTVKGLYLTHIAVYDETMREQIMHEQTITNEMHRALTEGQFQVWFKPQYNHSSNAMIGAEALVSLGAHQKGNHPT